MSKVYLCLDKHLNRTTAVKVLHDMTDEGRMLFQREARVIAQLEHENIVRIIDFGIEGDTTPYMVLEYADGESLESIIESGQMPSIPLALDYFCQIARALEHGHSNGIFHRDIKSSNVLITREDVVRIIDFGIAARLGEKQEATMFQGRTIVGTPKYMSPDQIQGFKFDARSEIYSFGCLMYEVLSGRVPFEGDESLALLSKHAKDPVPTFEEIRPDHIPPEEIQQIIYKCLEKNPNDRFNNVEELLEQLEAARDSIDQRETEPKHTRSESSSLQGNPGTKLMRLSALALLLVLTTICTYRTYSRKPGVEASHDITKNKTALRAFTKISVPSLRQAPMPEDFLLMTTPVQDGFRTVANDPNVSDDDIEGLPNDSNITELDLNNSQIGVGTLKNISRFPIRKLILQNCNIEDDDLLYLAKLPRLNVLSLVGCKKVSGKGLRYLTRLPMEMLLLDNTSLKSENLGYLPKMSKLSVLTMTNTEVGDSGLLILNRCPNLKRLTISSDDKNHQYFKTIEKLAIPLVTLSGTKPISDENLLCMRNRSSMGFSYLPVSKAQLELLKKFPNLRSLSILTATDEQMKTISELPLTCLSISGKELTSQGLSYLKDMKDLIALEALGLRARDRWVIEDLRKRKPQMTIYPTYR